MDKNVTCMIKSAATLQSLGVPRLGPPSKASISLVLKTNTGKEVHISHCGLLGEASEPPTKRTGVRGCGLPMVTGRGSRLCRLARNWAVMIHPATPTPSSRHACLIAHVHAAVQCHVVYNEKWKTVRGGPVRLPSQTI